MYSSKNKDMKKREKKEREKSTGDLTHSIPYLGQGLYYSKCTNFQGYNNSLLQPTKLYNIPFFYQIISYPITYYITL